jgi:hypothetical protein
MTLLLDVLNFNFKDVDREQAKQKGGMQRSDFFMFEEINFLVRRYASKTLSVAVES